jgi:hypothetical protein
MKRVGRLWSYPAAGSVVSIESRSKSVGTNRTREDGSPMTSLTTWRFLACVEG